MPDGVPDERAIEGEVTRFESVRYLEGAPGHATLSILFLAVGAALGATGRGTLATVAVIVAYGVSANGFSIFAWNRLRDGYEARAENGSGDGGPARELIPYRPSAEMKAELFAGFVMVGGFLVAFGLLTVGLERYGGRGVVALAGTALGIGNLLALALVYRAA